MTAKTTRRRSPRFDCQGRTYIGKQVRQPVREHAFAEAREKTGYYSNINKPPPQFYEIKCLGGDRDRTMGRDESQIQALYGHSDKATIESYLSGLEPPRSEVTSG